MLDFCQAQPKLDAEMAIFSIITTTHPATHPDKYKFGTEHHRSLKDICLHIWIIADLDQHQA